MEAERCILLPTSLVTIGIELPVNSSFVHPARGALIRILSAEVALITLRLHFNIAISFGLSICQTCRAHCHQGGCGNNCSVFYERIHRSILSRCWMSPGQRPAPEGVPPN